MRLCSYSLHYSPQEGRSHNSLAPLGSSRKGWQRQPFEYLLWTRPLDWKYSPGPSPSQILKSLPRKLRRHLDFLAGKRKKWQESDI